ncbi:MAG: PAQR family membrane homeostasis protein TrhA [Rubripirellula sp.]
MTPETEVTQLSDHGDAPLQLDQEWANALTHGLGALGSLFLGAHLVISALSKSEGLAIACGAYAASVFGTFLCSTLSHVVRRQPLLDKMRAWDQAMIYTMISGTYTPIAFYYASDSTRTPLLWAIWIAAAAGFLHKVALKHRVNSIGTVSYLLLGWLPAIPLAPHVPAELITSMFVGGVLYTVGVVFLVNDGKLRYLHACWHLAVMAGAACHYCGILWYVVQA